MQDPGILFHVILIVVCLLLAFGGVFVLANFGRLFKGRIKNEALRKNVVAWLAICCISAAISPMSNGFVYMLQGFGWWGVIALQLGSTTAHTILTYNTARMVAENRRVKELSFIKHHLLVLAVIILMAMVVNLPSSYIIFRMDISHLTAEHIQYLKHTALSSIYSSALTVLIYAAINYLDIERKRKFDEKELELSRLRELKTKAELEVLHSKINPHFLYNALNSIADLSITDGKKARTMTVALADLFRYSINYSNHNYSTIKDELEMAEVYLQIEKIRFEDQLTYSLQLDNDVKHYLVPRFILQPVVENAVKHGLKATGKMTEILVEVKKSDEGLRLIVADNGPLFPAELSPGYGVKSIFDKLDLLFPGQYDVHFSNEPRKEVIIHIKKLMKDEPAV